MFSFLVIVSHSRCLPDCPDTSLFPPILLVSSRSEGAGGGGGGMPLFRPLPPLPLLDDDADEADEHREGDGDPRIAAAGAAVDFRRTSTPPPLAPLLGLPLQQLLPPPPPTPPPPMALYYNDPLESP